MVAEPPTGSAVPTSQAGVLTGEIVIDGRLDEDVWQSAPVATGFVQREPFEGQPAEQPTEVRVLLDEDAIYIGARMFEADTSRIRRPLVRRGQGGPFQDWFSVSLDTNRDGRTAYRFQVNAAGVQVDSYHYDDDQQDGSWDGVWESAVTVDSLGWTAELRIPLSQLRYETSTGPQPWGVNFQRRRSAAGEVSQFALERRSMSGVVSQYGLLENVHVPSRARRVAVRPYALSSLHRGPSEEGNPFFDGREVEFEMGTDFRVGLGSSFTLDGTLNPDFGQVEADPSEINLTAFETFFDERRPFFIEDAQVFDFQLSGRESRLFYSRRIGGAPHGTAPASAEFVDTPDAARILGATKLTGRTPSGLSVGALAAVTQREAGRGYFGDAQEVREYLAEPRTAYGVATVQQDFRGGASQVRGIVTAVDRSLPSGDVLPLPDQGFTGGFALDHQWWDRTWRVNAFFSGSHVRGSPEAMTEVQRSSNHYFQRPDATRVELDPHATSMSGVEWMVRLYRQDREHWTGQLWLSQVSTGFEANDVGFSSNRERLNLGMRYGYRDLRPGSFFREYEIEAFTRHDFSHEGFDDLWSWDSWRRAYTAGTFQLEGDFTHLSYHGANFSLGWDPNRYSRSATRGGPIMIEPGGLTGRIGVRTDQRRDTNFEGGVELSRGSMGSGGEVAVDGSLNLRPSTQFQVEIGPRFSLRTDGAQYVTATSAVPYQETFGQRYLFGHLELTTLSLQTRASYVFSPTLSLQVYVEPFLSSGNYLRYRALAAPGTYELDDFQEGTWDGESVRCVGGEICQDDEGTQHLDLNGDGLSDFAFRDQNFNVRSLIGNAVLRWEYRPGSTLFVVWQREQLRREPGFGEFAFQRDLRAL